MKGWKLTAPHKLEMKELEEPAFTVASSKVKITKSLITLSDLLRYRGDVDSNGIVLGCSGIGIVSETDANLLDLEKGKHIYIDPNRECNKCYNCKNREYQKCSDLQTAGEDFDGFLSDFVSATPDKLFLLPESVSDFEALFIDKISLAVSIFDKLNIKKGDYVSVIGANNFGIVFAQLLIYYQAVPVIMTLDEESYNIAKSSGIYYALGPDDNWQKELSAITSGRMTDKVVYIADCDIQIAKAFSLASFGASVAFTGVMTKSTSVSFMQAIKKHLDITCINNGYGYATTSINLLANKAINLSCLKLDTASYENIPEAFARMNELYEKEGKFYETVVDLI
ncbi:MAG: alcohol dehydrogenase catalytic domain-containing protein [Candidatus Borkfalkiaceae bacterium]|nr:alcohol dehydrogenase catalytic domain-containing protein [Christensenellaceae bacterium]